jgi:purine-binding chemotaxis protein CheW
MQKEEDVLLQQINFVSMGNQLITFTIGEELYGVDILKIQELIGFSNVTQVPNLPEYILGVINLRGNVIPVIDLRIKFGMEPKEYNKFNVIIVLNVDGRYIGLVVDSVHDVVSLSDDKIGETPSFTTQIDTTFIKNISHIDGKLVVILDTNKILSVDEINNVSKSV